MIIKYLYINKLLVLVNNNINIKSSKLLYFYKYFFIKITSFFLMIFIK